MAGAGTAAAVAVAATLNAEPQSPQNRALGALDAPHAEHAIASRVPHSAQNLRPDSLDAPQLEQSTRDPPLPVGRQRTVRREAPVPQSDTRRRTEYPKRCSVPPGVTWVWPRVATSRNPDPSVAARERPS